MSYISSQNPKQNPLLPTSVSQKYEATYHITESIAIDEDGNAHLTYGIVAKGKDGAILAKISDITLHKSSLEVLVAVMNQNKLALCHMKDVIEDFLA